jgi:hypothetical protein
MTAQIDAGSNDFENRFWQHFPRQSNDFALLVLKGHLLVEENFNRLLAALLHTPEAIDGANLRFYQKLCLIRALTPVGTPVVGWIFRIMDAAEKLNTIRNRLAHHLDYPQMEAQVRDFLSDDPGDEAEPLVVRLRVAIALLCYNFDTVIEAVIRAK